jgi:hypothetical protein
MTTQNEIRAIWTVLGVWAAIWAVLLMWPRVPQPSWDGSQWSCPAGWSVYADQQEAEAGSDKFVHCVR